MFCKHEETLLLLSVSTALRHAVSVHGCQSVPVTDTQLSPSLRFTASSSLSFSSMLLFFSFSFLHPSPPLFLVVFYHFMKLITWFCEWNSLFS